MARYSTFKYGTEVYGATVPDNLIWGLEVDWDDDGLFNGAVEAGRLMAVSIERGRNYLFSPSGDGLEAAAPGRMELLLDNSDGRYDAYNTGSPLYPSVAPGRFIRLRARNGANIYALMSGTIQTITPTQRGQVTAITVEDGVRWLQDITARTAIAQNTLAGAAIGAVLDAAQWPSLWGRDIAAGADPLDYWWAGGLPAYDEIKRLADSELGHFCHAADGRFVFRDRHTAQASAASVDQSELLVDMAIPQPWEVRRNLIEVTGNLQSVGTEVELWSTMRGVALSPGESTTLEAELGGPAINVVTPVATTDYTAFSLSDGQGTNLTSSIGVAMTAYAESAELVITNNGTQLAYINFLQVRGQPLTSVPVTARASTAARKPQRLALNLAWQQDVNNPASFAAQLLAHLSGAGPMPEVIVEQRPDIQFAVDLFDLVDVSIAGLGILGTFRVGRIRHTWLAQTGQAVQTAWQLEPYLGYNYWRFPVTFHTTSIFGW